MVPEVRGVCAAPVPDDAPFAVCQPHLARAWQFCADKIATQRRKEVEAVYGEREQAKLDKFAEMNALRAEMERRKAEHKAEIERVREEARREAIALAATAEAAESGCVVYYLRFGDRVKIGYTSDIAKRRTQIPNDELLATEPGGRVVESMRHRQFKAHRLVGEWFAMAPDLVAHIDQLNAPEAFRVAREAELDAAHAESIRDIKGAHDDAARSWLATPDELVPSDPAVLLAQAIGIPE